MSDLDARLFLWCFEKTRNRVFDALMPVLSIAANRGLIQIAGGVAMIAAGMLSGNEYLVAAALCMLAGAGAAGVIAEFTIKLFWKRERPFMRFDHVSARVPHRRLKKRPSFPSGHSAGYMASAAALGFFYPSLAAVFAAVALLGGYSRIYNGVHYPSDVAAGLGIGAACGLGAAILLGPLLIG